jgi:hypothetical protein
MPGFPITDYTLGAGAYAVAKHGFFLPWFLLGTYLGVGVAAAGLWVARRRQSTLLLLLVGVVFPLGYLPFWGTKVSSEFTRLSGPIYYLPIYASVAVLMAITLVRLHERHRASAAGLALALVLATVPAAVSRFDVNQELSVSQDRWRTSVASIDEPAVVFVGDANPYLLFSNPFSSNGAQLDDRILYAVDELPGMLDLIAEQPERTPYLQLATSPVQDLGPKEDPVDFDVVLLPVTVERGSTLQLQVAAGDRRGEAIASVTVGVAKRSVRRSAPVGTELAPITIGPPGGSADLTLPSRGLLRITLGYGATEADALRSPVAQQRMVFRLVDETVEALLPTSRFSRDVFGDHEEWRRRLDTPDLAVEVTATE